LLVGILSITAFETERAFTNQSVAATTRGLAAEVDSFDRAVGGARPSTLEPDTVAYLRSRVLPQGETIMVRLSDGSRLGSVGSASLLQTPTFRSALESLPARTASFQSVVDGVATLYLVTPIRSGATSLGTMVVTADLSQLRTDQNRALLLILAEALVALVGAVAGAYLLLRRLLRNVGRITTTAASIKDGELDRRLGDQGTDDEVGQLAATFDAMLDRLQAAMTVQRRLLSDVSHQLRTPLTVARGHLEVLARQDRVERDEVRDTVGVVVDELEHMGALVERLLMLGRALEPDFLDSQPLDLRAFLSELLESAQVLAPRSWFLDPVPDLVLDVDVAKLRGALLNLIDNAVRATTGTDAIEIGAVLNPGTGDLTVSVDDSGPGIPGDELPTVIERFRRLGGADRDGTGLGLAIVTAVAEAHGGSFELGRSPLGGCRAAIVLPEARIVAHPLLVPEGV